MTNRYLKYPIPIVLNDGIPGFVYGLFKGTYIVGYVVMGFLNKTLLQHVSARCVILTGLYAHGVCLILAGIAYTLLMTRIEGPSTAGKTLFQVLTCLFQGVQGGMMSSVTLSALSLGSVYFKDEMGKVNGTYYLGCVIPHGIVPVIANWAYHSLGGYAPPLYTFGVLAFVLSTLAYFIFVVKDLDLMFEEEDGGKISTLPYRTFIPLVQSYILTAYLSYLQLTLPKFAVERLGFSVVAASTTLTVLMMSIAVVNVLITFVCSGGSSTRILHVLMFCCLVDALASFFLFPPQDATASWISFSHYLTYPLLCLIGVSDAYSTINTTPAMVYLYSTARVREPSQAQKHTMSSLWIAGNGFAYALGAYLAGFIDEMTGQDLHRAGVLWGSLAVVCVVSLLLPILSFNNTGEQYKICDNESQGSSSR